MIEEDYNIGNSENIKETLEPKDVVVKDISKIDQQLKDGKNKQIIALYCQHPDKETVIEIRKIKYLKSNTLVVEGLWLTLDNEGKIAKLSALGKLMQFYKVNKLNELVGKTLKTSTNEEKYLVIKAYD